MILDENCPICTSPNIHTECHRIKFKFNRRTIDTSPIYVKILPHNCRIARHQSPSAGTQFFARMSWEMDAKYIEPKCQRASIHHCAILQSHSRRPLIEYAAIMFAQITASKFNFYLFTLVVVWRDALTRSVKNVYKHESLNYINR